MLASTAGAPTIVSFRFAQLQRVAAEYLLMPGSVHGHLQLRQGCAVVSLPGTTNRCHLQLSCAQAALYVQNQPPSDVIVEAI